MMRLVLLAQFKTVSTSIIQTWVYFPTLLNTHLVTHPAPVLCTPHTASVHPCILKVARDRRTPQRGSKTNTEEKRKMTPGQTLSQHWESLSPCRPEPDLVFLPTLLVNGCLLVSAEACRCWTLMEQPLGWAAVTEGESLTVEKMQTSHCCGPGTPGL